jgi:hypothetical protein
MTACPFCERYSEHLPEDCRLRASFDDEQVWQLFVLNRRGKSQFRTRDVDLVWPNIVRARFAQMPDEGQQQYYPHSRGFALEQLVADPHRYRTHNYRYEPVGLVADPRTTNRDSLLQDRELALPYQTGAERHWEDQPRSSADQRSPADRDGDRDGDQQMNDADLDIDDGRRYGDWNRDEAKGY